MKLGKLRLKNYTPFKKASFDLDYVGITHIQASNRDAQTGAGLATNAAGKSRLFGAIPEAVWGQSPTGKDSVKQKTASAISFEVKDVGAKQDTYEIIRRFGKNKGFTIKRNGTDINIRTIDLGAKRAQAILGMSEADFYTRCYIDSLIPHPLITGSAAIRQDFFVDMFGLHSMDSIRKLLLAEYREAQQNRASYLEVRSLFEEMKDKAIDSKVLATKEIELSTLTEKQTWLLEEFRKTQSMRDLLMFESDNEALIRKTLKLGELDQFEGNFKECKRKLNKAMEQQEEALAWRVYDKQLESYRATARPLRKALEKLIGSDWERQTCDVSEKAKKAREARSTADSLAKELSRLEDVEKPEAVDEPKYSLDQCTLKLTALREEMQHAKEFKDGKCPTCGSTVKGRDSTEIQQETAKWKDRKNKTETYSAWLLANKRSNEVASKRTTLQHEVEVAEANAQKRSRWIEAESLSNQIPDIPAPPGATRDVPEGLDEKIEKLNKRLNVFRAARPVIDKIREVSDLSDKQRRKAEAFDQLGDQLNEINNKISTLTADINVAKAAHQQLKQLAQRGKTLKNKAEDEPILKALIEVHSNKGLKKMMIQHRAKQLQDQINKFRRLLFAEDFHFEFRYDKKLELLVHRKYGKMVSVSDVRKLSGAEKRMFTILLVVATITLLPKSQRCNVLILDEPESNLGPATLNAFVKALPVLNKIIPHIVVVTPRPELEIPGARVFTVVKQQGVSTIQKGAPV